MPTLKCTSCNKEFKSGFIAASEIKGMSGIKFGSPKTLKVFPVWPFQTSLVSACPNCNKNTKLLVVASKTTKIVTTLIVIAVVIFIILLLSNKLS